MGKMRYKTDSGLLVANQQRQGVLFSFRTRVEQHTSPARSASRLNPSSRMEIRTVPEESILPTIWVFCHTLLSDSNSFHNHSVKSIQPNFS